MLCRAKQARKRGGYAAAAVLALVALRIRVICIVDVCNRARTRHVRLNCRRRRWENGRSQGGGDDAKYISRLTRTPLSSPRWSVPDRSDATMKKAWHPRPGVISREEPRSRFSKMPISRTQNTTTQNRSTGCVQTQRRTRSDFDRSSSVGRSPRLGDRTAASLSVSCARQADLWILKKSTVTRRKARQPDGRAEQPSVGRRWQRTGWFGWLANVGSKRSGGAYQAFGDAGCKGWRAGVANPTYFFNAPKQSRTASVSGVPPTTPPGTSTVS